MKRDRRNYSKAYYITNKDRITAYKTANKEKIAVVKVAYFHKNHEAIKAYKRDWYKANRERLLAKQKILNAAIPTQSYSKVLAEKERETIRLREEKFRINTEKSNELARLREQKRHDLKRIKEKRNKSQLEQICDLVRYELTCREEKKVARVAIKARKTLEALRFQEWKDAKKKACQERRGISAYRKIIAQKNADDILSVMAEETTERQEALLKFHLLSHDIFK